MFLPNFIKICPAILEFKNEDRRIDRASPKSFYFLHIMQRKHNNSTLLTWIQFTQPVFNVMQLIQFNSLQFILIFLEFNYVQRNLVEFSPIQLSTVHFSSFTLGLISCITQFDDSKKSVTGQLRSCRHDRSKSYITQFEHKLYHAMLHRRIQTLHWTNMCLGKLSEVFRVISLHKCINGNIKLIIFISSLLLPED
jgi:hypothetical protein